MYMRLMGAVGERKPLFFKRFRVVKKSSRHWRLAREA